MAFEEGHEKLGGRQKGTGNKLTKEIRATLKQILSDEIEKLPQLLESLPPKERMEYVIKILPFVLPKVESVASEEGEPFSFGQ